MFRLKRKYEFHAARKLTSLRENHPCGELHGHTFTVTIKVSGNQLTDEGWIMDFYDIDKLFKEKVHKTLDHKYEGKLTDANDKYINIVWKVREPKPVGKGKVTVEKSIDIDLDKIKEAKVKIKF